jgi:hypothetical protein
MIAELAERIGHNAWNWDCPNSLGVSSERGDQASMGVLSSHCESVDGRKGEALHARLL